MEIKEKIFRAAIRPNSPSNEIVGFNKDKNAYLIKIKAMPKDNRTNMELVKFLSKVLGKIVKIKSGFILKKVEKFLFFNFFGILEIK